jgi:catechol 2,3-dioxygenase-like lactoylglutathione lyase family enzyme
MKTSGLDHIVLTVSNLERSRNFYAEILGFDVKSIPASYSNPIFAGSCFFHAGDIEIFLIQHPQTISGDRFDEMRVGLDHLSFRAPDEAALNELAERLIEAGVETKGVEVFLPPGKKYVSFRDPDNIQLEYWLN